MYTDMTNIVKNPSEKKVHSHISKAYDFLDAHLPYEYANEVVKNLKKKNVKVTSAVVRNVRAARTTGRIDILNALLLVAKKNKKQLEKIETTINT